MLLHIQSADRRCRDNEPCETFDMCKTLHKSGEEERNNIGVSNLQHLSLNARHPLLYAEKG